MTPTGASIAQYVVEVRGCGEAWRTSLLERAISRLDPCRDGAVRLISVDVAGARLRVTMDVVGRPRRAAREAERVFAQIWYDAFGERDVGHSGHAVEGG